MSPQLLVAALAAAALVVIATGIAMTRAGRPYGGALLNIHKLVDLAAVVYIGYAVFQTQRSTPLPVFVWAIALGALAFVIGAFATGGVASGMANPPSWVGRAHAATAWVAAGLSAVTYYLVAMR